MDTSDDKFKPVKGWIEILYRKMPLDLDVYDVDTYSVVNQRVPTIGEFTKVDYQPVGSWLPLEEFIHTMDVLEFLQQDVADMYNVPRSVQAFDAFNLCPVDPAQVKTLIVVPRDHTRWYKQCQPQVNLENDLALIGLPSSFESFRKPDWPNG